MPPRSSSIAPDLLQAIGIVREYVAIGDRMNRGEKVSAANQELFNTARERCLVPLARALRLEAQNISYEISDKCFKTLLNVVKPHQAALSQMNGETYLDQKVREEAMKKTNLAVINDKVQNILQEAKIVESVAGLIPAVGPEPE